MLRLFKKLKLSGNCYFNHLFEEAATIYVVLVHDGVEHHLKYTNTTALYSHKGNQIRVCQIEEDIMQKVKPHMKAALVLMDTNSGKNTDPC